MTTELDGSLSLVPSSTVKQLTLDFTEPNGVPVVSSTEIHGSLISIPGVVLPMAELRFNLGMTYDGVELGRVDTPYAKTSAPASGLITTMAPAPITIDAKALAGFNTLMKDIIATDSVTIPLEGKMDISFYLKLPFPMTSGPRVLTSIGYATETDFPGLNGLPDIKFVSLTANAPSADKTTQIISFKVNIKVASALSVKLGDVGFKAAGPDGPIGTTTLKALTLVHGDNIIEVVTVVDLSLAGAAAFLSGLSTAETALTLTGFADSTTNPLIVSAVEALTLKVAIPKQ